MILCLFRRHSHPVLIHWIKGCSERSLPLIVKWNWIILLQELPLRTIRRLECLDRFEQPTLNQSMKRSANGSSVLKCLWSHLYPVPLFRLLILPLFAASIVTSWVDFNKARQAGWQSFWQRLSLSDILLEKRATANFAARKLHCLISSSDFCSPGSTSVNCSGHVEPKQEIVFMLWTLWSPSFAITYHKRNGRPMPSRLSTFPS